MVRTVLVSGICVVGLILFARADGDNRAGHSDLRRARRYFRHPNPTDRTDSLALTFYQKAVRLLKPDRLTAQVRFESFERIGILSQTFGNQSTALTNYRRAIATHRQFGLSDSLLFIPYLYSGTAHYFQHAFDSSSHYFGRAEQIYDRYPRVPEAQRLFNSLGALYYEAGNYRQSINYFQKALQLHLRKGKPDSSAIYSYKSNLASALRHLDQYDSAATIYQSLIPLAPHADLLYINLALTYLDQRKPARALPYLAKVAPNSPSKIRLENALGAAYLQLGHDVKAEQHLRRALATHRQEADSHVKNDRIGLTYQLLGDLARQRQQLGKAIAFYQRSIIELDYDFGATDPRQNPQNFSQNFGSYVLFESLAAKADCWLARYRQQPDEQHRRAALDTYRSAFRLAEYIEKSFDNEEARLFIGQKVYPVVQRAVSFLIDTYEATGRNAFLIEAFRWSEQSKAAVLAMTIQENRVKSGSGLPDSLLSRERDLRYQLSRLRLRVQNAVSGKETEALATQMRDTELNLSRLIARLNAYPSYYRQKFGFDSLNVDQLRRNWLGSATALLSYFYAPDAVFGFVVTRRRIDSFRIPNDRAFGQTLNRLLRSLRTIQPGQAFAQTPDARFLYQRLLGPALPHLSGIRSLILVPHDALRLLPFEALQDADQRYVLETYDVTYQYSATFLHPQPVPVGQRESDVTGPVRLDNALALAPFYDAGSIEGYAPLPASYGEVNSLTGKRLLGRSATKARFLASAGQYSVIHLATHAVVDNHDPQRSFVAFHPASGPGHRLYAYELSYGLLPRTQLVFLSACETASGKLIRGEGVMSLSRAFSLAGCPNLVTSLWKAEDNATAYISTQFYVHLRAGLPPAEALQRAKLDLLHNPAYAQFHAPPYWSHLILIGTPGRSEPGWGRWLLVTFAVLVGVLLLWWWQRSRLIP